MMPFLLLLIMQTPTPRTPAATRAGMELVMGKLPDPASKTNLDVRCDMEESLPTHTRKKISYVAEAGDRVPAYLLIPKGLKGKAPAMLCLHQTIKIGKGEPVGLGTQESKRYGLHLVERGYVVLAPDYPSFGDYAYDFAKSPHQSGSMKAIWNNIRGVDLLESLPEVDAKRIGCIGHSLGGHNALFTAVFEPRLRVIVSSCGYTSFPKYYNGNLKGWTSDRYMPRIASVYQSRPDRMPFDFVDIVASLAPRPCLSCSPLHDDNFEVSGVREVITAAKPIYAMHGAEERLMAIYPDCKHDFPTGVRKEAYAWIDRWLKSDTPP